VDKPARILIVESKPDLLRSLQTLFHEAGHQTRGAGSDSAARQPMASFWPDLILSSVRTSDIDGLALARQVKETSDVPIVFLTAIPDRDVLLTSLRSYVEDFVTLPFDPDELVARVECVLQRVGPGLAQPIVTAGSAIVDFCRGKIYNPDLVYEPSAAEAHLLYHLARHAAHHHGARHRSI
jgi:DNA-binding response OmpR family regulator